MLWTPGDGTYTYTTHNRSALRLSRSVRCASKSRLTTLAHGLCASRCGRRWEAMGGDAEATTGAVEEAHGRLVRRARLNVGCVGLGVWLKGTSRAQVAGCGRGHEPRRKRRRRTRGAGDGAGRDVRAPKRTRAERGRAAQEAVRGGADGWRAQGKAVGRRASGQQQRGALARRCADVGPLEDRTRRSRRGRRPSAVAAAQPLDRQQLARGREQGRVLHTTWPG